MYASYSRPNEFDLSETQERWWQYGFKAFVDGEHIKRCNQAGRHRCYARAGYFEAQLQQEQLDSLERSLILS